MEESRHIRKNPERIAKESRQGAYRGRKSAVFARPIGKNKAPAFVTRARPMGAPGQGRATAEEPPIGGVTGCAYVEQRRNGPDGEVQCWAVVVPMKMRWDTVRNLFKRSAFITSSRAATCVVRC